MFGLTWFLLLTVDLIIPLTVHHRHFYAVPENYFPAPRPSHTVCVRSAKTT